jgi:hypothetical protein
LPRTDAPEVAMELTKIIAKVIGPVLLLRAVSILLERDHFTAMLRDLDREVSTITFSFFPVALLMACIALVLVHSDTSSLAGMLVRIIAWAGILKSSALILFPRFVVAKAHVLAEAGFLNVVLVACTLVGGYFTWFGYFASEAIGHEPSIAAPRGLRN